MGIVDHVPGLLGKVSKRLGRRSFQLKCVSFSSINITLSIWFDIWICFVFTKIQKLVGYGFKQEST